MRKIGLMSLRREYPCVKKQILKNIKGCVKSHHWVLGEAVREFENKISGYLGVRHAVGVASGTDALILALRALAMARKNKDYFDRRDEVITTPLTFIATAEAIVHSGATPVFVDIDPDTFNINPLAVKKAVNKNTVGIMPVHLYGLGCDMGQISKIARENGLFVVEDNAQSLGGRHKTRMLGSIGDCGCHSFFPSKTLGGWGDGGMVVTGSHKIAQALKTLRNHGQAVAYDASFIGYNSRLDSLQAAVLSAKLACLDRFIALRQKVADRYKKAFAAIKEIVPQRVDGGYRHAYGLYTIKINAGLRDKLLAHLNAENIESRVYYPVPLHEMKAFRAARISGELKAVNDIKSRILTIPLHPFLKDGEVSRIIKTIITFFRSRQ